MTAGMEVKILIMACESLVNELRIMMDWARELPSQYLDGDPQIRAVFADDLKRARSVIIAANDEISKLKGIGR